MRLKEPRDWTSKRVLVTGATQGIGRALASTLAQRGAVVLAVARSAKDLSALVRESEGLRGSCHPLVADLASGEGLERILAWVDAEWGAPHVLINNAAVGHSSAIVETPWEITRRVIDTNYVGVVRLCQELGGRMCGRQGGVVVVLSSLAGKFPFRNLGIYTSTKWALEGFALALREELAGSGVRVLLVRPGPTRTGFFRAAGIEVAADRLARMRAPEEVAARILDGIEQGKDEMTIGPDRYLLLASRLLPQGVMKRLLPLFT